MCMCEYVCVCHDLCGPKSWHRAGSSIGRALIWINERLTDHTRLGTRPAHEFSELTMSENRVRSNICSYTTHNVAG